MFTFVIQLLVLLMCAATQSVLQEWELPKDVELLKESDITILHDLRPPNPDRVKRSLANMMLEQQQVGSDINVWKFLEISHFL